MKATEDTETPPPTEVTAALDAAAKAATAEQAELMARWLAKRLDDGLGELTGSIPTTVKTLDCISHIRIRVGCDVINRW